MYMTVFIEYTAVPAELDRRVNESIPPGWRLVSFAIDADDAGRKRVLLVLTR